MASRKLVWWEQSRDTDLTSGPFEIIGLLWRRGEVGASVSGRDWVRNSLMHSLICPLLLSPVVCTCDWLRFIASDTLGLCSLWVSNLHEHLDHAVFASVYPTTTITSMQQAHLEHRSLKSLHTTSVVPTVGSLEKGSGFHLPRWSLVSHSRAKALVFAHKTLSGSAQLMTLVKNTKSKILLKAYLSWTERQGISKRPETNRKWEFIWVSLHFRAYGSLAV